MTNWCVFCQNDPCVCRSNPNFLGELRQDNKTLRAKVERLTRENAGWQERAVEKGKYIVALNDEITRLTRERDQLREQLAEAHTQIDELRNVVQVAAFALAKREPEPLTETRTR